MISEPGDVQCETCDTVNLCHTFLQFSDLTDPSDGKLKMIIGCKVGGYVYGDELTAENERTYAALVTRRKKGVKR